jgi:aryl-alcohol dehydrogenase-like predicted oxidoreductase
LSDPVEEAWNAESWAIPKTALAVIGMPLNIIPAGVTTSLGYEKASTLWDAAEDYANSKKWEPGTRWGLEGLALGADLTAGAYTDPLSVLSSGGSLLWKSARTLIEEGAPQVAAMRDIEKIKDAQKYYRYGAEVSEENVRRYAAPKMIADSLKNTFDKKLQISELHPGIQSTYGDYDLFSYFYGDKAAESIPTGSGLKSVDKLRSEFRVKPLSELEKKYTTLNSEIITDESIPLAEKLEHLAGHEEFLVKKILDGAPRLRVHLPLGVTASQIAKNYKEGIAIAPSPSYVLGKALRGVAGTWVEQKGLLKPIKDSLASIPGLPQDIAEYVTGAGYRSHVSSAFNPVHMNSIELEQFMLQEQTPWRLDPEKATNPKLAQRRDFEGVITKPQALIEYVTDELKSLPQHQRIPHLRNIKSAYRGLEEVMVQNPDALFASKVEDVREARQILDDMYDNVLEKIDDVDFQLDPDYEGVYDITQVEGDAIHQFRLKRMQDETIDLFKTIVDKQEEYHAALDGMAKIGLGSPEEVVQAAVEALKSSGVYDQLPEMLFKALNNYRAMVEMTTPFNYALENRNALKDIAKYSKEISNLSFLNQEIVRDSFVKKAGMHLDAIKVMGGMLKDKNGRDLMKRMANLPAFLNAEENKNLMQLASGSTLPEIEPITSLQSATKWASVRPPVLNASGKVIVEGRTAQQIAAERAEMNKILSTHMANLVKRGEMDQADVTEVAQFIGNLDDENFANLVFCMQDLAQAHAVMSFESALQDRVMTPIKKGIEGAQGVINKEYDIIYRQLGNKFSALQARYKPREDPLGFIKHLMAPGGVVDECNQLMETAFRKAGFGKDSIEKMQKYTENNAMVKPLSEEHGVEFSRNQVVEPAERLVPGMKGRITQRKENALNEAVGDYVQYYYTKKQYTPDELKVVSAVDLDTAGPEMAACKRQLDISEAKISSALQRLTEIFGDRTIAQKYADDVLENTAKYTDTLYAEEKRMGLAGLYRKYYVPYMIKGDSADKAVLREIMEGENTVNRLAGKDKAIISRSFGPSEHRRFFDAASLQDFINQINKERELRKLPALKVEVESHLSAVIGNRKKIQLQALNNRLAIDTLEAVLPGQMRIIFGLSEEGVKAVEATKGFKNLGGLIPAMEGKYISEDLYHHLDKYIPKYEQENKLLSWIRSILSKYSRFQVSISPAHLKNLGSLAYIAGTNPMGFARVIKDAIAEQHKFEDAYPGASNLVQRLGLALEDSDLYKRAIRSGVTHFRGADQFASVADNIKKSMRTASRASRIMNNGLWGNLIFNVLDRAVKMTTFDQFVKMGLPERMAADWTNHYLIDYTGKNLDPTLRKWMHTFMPFVGWRVGNALLHIPNMVENPRKYALIFYMRNYLADHVWKSNPFIGSNYPDALQFTLPTPMYDNDGNQIFYAGDLPWEPYIRLASRTVVTNPSNPWLFLTELAKFNINHTYYGELLREAYSPTAMKALKKESGFDTVFWGTPKREPVINSLLWGSLPYINTLSHALVDSIINRDVWSDWTPFVFNNIGRYVPVTGSGKIARPLGYAESWQY